MSTEDKPSSGVLSSVLTIPTDDGQARKIHVRTGGDPIGSAEHTVVLVPGLGLSCLTFSTVQLELAKLGIASLTYDRPGIGRSSSLPKVSRPDKPAEEAPAPRPASELAKELDHVLQAKLPSPYVFVTHSAGGLTIWEYVAAHPEKVAGLIFLDANSPDAVDRAISDPDLECLSEGVDGGLDYGEIIGLTDAHRLPMEEWEELNDKRDPPAPWHKSENGAWAESLVWHDSCRSLRRHNLPEQHPLGDRPVTVIKGFSDRDIRKYIAASERLGGGTKEQRDDILRRLEGADAFEEVCQRRHLELTATGERRFVYAHRSGHYPHITEQDLVVDEIARMVEQVRSS